MILSWAETAWEDYLCWQATDKKVLKRINHLISDIQRHPFSGLGDPEPLRHQWTGYGRAVSTESIGLFIKLSMTRSLLPNAVTIIKQRVRHVSFGKLCPSFLQPADHAGNK